MVFIPFIQSHPDSMYVNMTAIQADVLVSNKVNIPGGKLAAERISSCTGSSQRSPKVRRQRIIPPIFLFVKTVEPILTGDALPTVFLFVCVCVNIPLFMTTSVKNFANIVLLFISIPQLSKPGNNLVLARQWKTRTSWCASGVFTFLVWTLCGKL